jgi:hypothetical protein
VLVTFWVEAQENANANQVWHIGMPGGDGGEFTSRRAISNQLGSSFPQRENFRLTPEVKEKFTEKLKSDPEEFCGQSVSKTVRTDGLKLLPKV